MIIYGNRSGSASICVNPRDLMDKNIKVEGFYLGSYTRQRGLSRNMLDLIKIGNLMSSGMKIKIHDIFPLEKAQDAIDTYSENMSDGKVLLAP